MKILIIENEIPAAERIVMLLKKIDRTVTISAIVDSVESAVNFLQNESDPDLILMDIQLDDGLCFEIFEHVKVEIPVIFTTAFDEYTLKAFKVNSIDYLLKPIGEESLGEAIKKYKKLYYDKPVLKTDFKQLMNEFRNQYKSRFLIKIGEKFKSIPVRDIYYFHINTKNVFLRDFNGTDYGIDYSLDQLQSLLDPRKFFRINRDCIVNIEAITLMHSYSSSRLQLILKNDGKNELFVVSREKVSDFKKWIDR